VRDQRPNRTTQPPAGEPQDPAAARSTDESSYTAAEPTAHADPAHADPDNALPVPAGESTVPATSVGESDTAATAGESTISAGESTVPATSVREPRTATGATPGESTIPAGESSGPGVRRSGVRPLWTVILLLVLGAAVLWLASRLTWAWSRQLTPLRGTVVVTQRGSEVAAALMPLAFLALAAVAAILAIGGWWRRLVGVLVGVAGLASIWVGANGLPGVFAAHPDGYPLSQVVTGHALAVLAGVIVILAGALIVRNAAGMPRLGGTYQTPSAARRRRDPDTELWQALSEGRDPTASE